MKQSYFRYWGLLCLGLVGVFLAIFGLEATLSQPGIGIMAFAGVCGLLAGTVAELTVGPLAVSWRHFLAIGFLVSGLSLPLQYASALVSGTASGEELLMLVCGLAILFSLTYFSYMLLRGGDRVNIEIDVDRELGV
ncbi:hypothetical protein [Haloarchaeobius sp. DFWS5]|uniref:hypothetical protein n=1 Tax=Haloarchaeobius sp. DFWS5 TaxID=3446114 RepID=UPI003EBD2310